jgi:hypothetical protein
MDLFTREHETGVRFSPLGPVGMLASTGFLEISRITDDFVSQDLSCNDAQ